MHFTFHCPSNCLPYSSSCIAFCISIMQQMDLVIALTLYFSISMQCYTRFASLNNISRHWECKETKLNSAQIPMLRHIH